MTKKRRQRNVKAAAARRAIRQCVHLKLLKPTHRGLKKVAAEKGLSMQAIIQELVQHVVDGDPSVMEIVDELARRRELGRLESLMEMEADTIYDQIEQLSQLERSDVEEVDA